MHAHVLEIKSVLSRYVAINVSTLVTPTRLMVCCTPHHGINFNNYALLLNIIIIIVNMINLQHSDNYYPTCYAFRHLHVIKQNNSVNIINLYVCYQDRTRSP